MPSEALSLIEIGDSFFETLVTEITQMDGEYIADLTLGGSFVGFEAAEFFNSTVKGIADALDFAGSLRRHDRASGDPVILGIDHH